MGVREKVTLLLVLFVIVKVGDQSCLAKNLVNRPELKTFLDGVRKSNNIENAKQQLLKQRQLLKNRQNVQRARADNKESESVYKDFNFPDTEYPQSNSLRVPFYLRESNFKETNFSREHNQAKFLSSSIISKKKEAKLKRKSLGSATSTNFTNENNFQDFTPAPDPFSLRNVAVFPDVDYPLCAKDIWTKNYWNRLSDIPSFKPVNDAEIWGVNSKTCDNNAPKSLKNTHEQPSIPTGKRIDRNSQVSANSNGKVKIINKNIQYESSELEDILFPLKKNEKAQTHYVESYTADPSATTNINKQTTYKINNTQTQTDEKIILNKNQSIPPGSPNSYDSLQTSTPDSSFGAASMPSDLCPNGISRNHKGETSTSKVPDITISFNVTNDNCNSMLTPPYNESSVSAETEKSRYSNPALSTSSAFDSPFSALNYILSYLENMNSSSDSVKLNVPESTASTSSKDKEYQLSTTPMPMGFIDKMTTKPNAQFINQNVSYNENITENLNEYGHEKISIIFPMQNNKENPSKAGISCTDLKSSFNTLPFVNSTKQLLDDCIDQDLNYYPHSKKDEGCVQVCSSESYAERPNKASRDLTTNLEDQPYNLKVSNESKADSCIGNCSDVGEMRKDKVIFESNVLPISYLKSAVAEQKPEKTMSQPLKEILLDKNHTENYNKTYEELSDNIDLLRFVRGLYDSVYSCATKPTPNITTENYISCTSGAKDDDNSCVLSAFNYKNHSHLPLQMKVSQTNNTLMELEENILSDSNTSSENYTCEKDTTSHFNIATFLFNTIFLINDPRTYQNMILQTKPYLNESKIPEKNYVILTKNDTTTYANVSVTDNSFSISPVNEELNYSTFTNRSFFKNVSHSLPSEEEVADNAHAGNHIKDDHISRKEIVLNNSTNCLLSNDSDCAVTNTRFHDRLHLNDLTSKNANPTHMNFQYEPCWPSSDFQIIDASQSVQNASKQEFVSEVIGPAIGSFFTNKPLILVDLLANVDIFNNRSDQFYEKEATQVEKLTTEIPQMDINNAQIQSGDKDNIIINIQSDDKETKTNNTSILTGQIKETLVKNNGENSHFDSLIPQIGVFNIDANNKINNN